MPDTQAAQRSKFPGRAKSVWPNSAGRGDPVRLRKESPMKATNLFLLLAIASLMACEPSAPASPLDAQSAADGTTVEEMPEI